MESLYRKYRPLTFDSVVGQQHIVSTLENAVTEGRLSHAYLFCGPRGTGKTTMARILAKALLCQKAADAPRGTGCLPDGTCEECEAIAEGTHPDVYELDAASRTGVDNVREEIVNSVSFAPVRGKYKVYIIDEVHMLTTAAFNALLKTLEEPPAHVVFILCTTDPQKILETILSRCQRFDFHRISNEDLEARMRYVCEQEGFSFDDEALEIVARHARGGMRDALSTLEQLSVFGDGAVRTADARALLGEVSSAVLGEFCRLIAGRDVAGLFDLIRKQVDAGDDLMELTRDLVAHVRDVYTVRVAGADPDLVEGTADEVAALGEEAKLFETADRLARALTVLDDAALAMRDASDMRLVLEIACTRLARPESDLTLEALAERIDRLEAQLAAGVPSAPMDAATLTAATSSVSRHPERPAEPVTAPARPTEPPAASRHPAEPVASPRHPERSAEPVPAPRHPERSAEGAESKDLPTPAPAKPRTPSAAQVAASAAAPTPAVSDAGELQRKWGEVVKRVTAKQASRGALLQSARAQGDDGSTLTIALPAGSSFALKMLSRPDSHEVILPIVCAVFGSRSVEYVMGGAPAGGPSAPRPAPVPAKRPAPAPSRPQAAPAAPVQNSAPGAVKANDPVPSPVPAPSRPQAASPAPTSPVDVPPWEDVPSGTVSAAKSAPVPQPDHVSGPTVVPEPDVDADRAAWENDQVPYDDATVAAYEDDMRDEPPVDLPDAPAPAAGDAVSPSTRVPAASQPAPAPAPTAEARQGSAPDAGAGIPPWANHAGAPDEDAPQTTEDAKALLGDIFGAGVVFKDS